jgi:jumonji domain-containing protein 7
MNPSYVEEMHTVPSGLEFASAVKRNRPVVYRGLGKRKRVPALEKWTSRYLIDTMGDQKLRVAATPSGNADALVDDLFVEPECKRNSLRKVINNLRSTTDQSMTMGELLDRLSDIKRLQSEPVLYLQSQNDNLESELPQLREDATRGFDFAASVFESEPEVANVWIGDERSVTSLHKGE